MSSKLNATRLQSHFCSSKWAPGFSHGSKCDSSIISRVNNWRAVVLELLEQMLLDYQTYCGIPLESVTLRLSSHGGTVEGKLEKATVTALVAHPSALLSLRAAVPQSNNSSTRC
jgi:hypothetical protein